MNNDEKEGLRSILTTLAMFAFVGEQVRQRLFEEIENIFDKPEEKPVMGPQMNCGPLKVPQKEMTAKELVGRLEEYLSTRSGSEMDAYHLLLLAIKEAGL